LDILFIAAECAPFVKIGGLGDVVGSLPAALRHMGHSVRVIVPHHGTIDDARFGIRPLDTFGITWNGAVTRVEVAFVELNGVPVYFMRGWPFFGADEAFIYSHDEGIDVGRFLFMSAVSLEWVQRLAERENWAPQVVHAHDWHTGMVPFLLKRVYADDAVLSEVASLFSIHNMQYQGWGIGWHLRRAGLPKVDHPLLKAMDKTDNSLAIGLAYSTALSTVSPHYAEEITDPEGGYELDGLLHARQARLRGILNGIDTARWDPAAGANGVVPFDAGSLEKRAENKAALQAELGLPVRPDVALVGTVTRLVEQKGFSIMTPAVRHMLTHSEMQFALLGTGQTEYEHEMWRVGHDFPDKASIWLKFDEGLAERIYAGLDVFLMPSLFEPCGIGQMFAMRYGALPVVHEVGGLVDTVSPDTGFLFGDYSSGALQWALGRALDVYYNDPQGWRARQRRAMQRDFSWEQSAKRYVELYEEAIAIHSSYY
jgi:starch synthase